MEGKLIGALFIVLAAMLLTPAIMFCWYRFIRAAEKARTVSAITILIVSPVVTFSTLFWRWEITELKDHPSSGIPFFVAFIEIFWIWCASLIVLFVLHRWIANFFEKRRAHEKVDSDIFE